VASDAIVNIQQLVKTYPGKPPVEAVKGIDLAVERARLGKEMQKADADLARSNAKLNNPKFIEHAAEEVVEEEKEKRDEALARKAKITEALERLKDAG